MKVCLTGLDVHSIQDYLCASSKLREMVGASALVDHFTRVRPISTLEDMGLRETPQPESTGDWFVPIRAIGGVVRILLPDKKHGVAWARQITSEILERSPGLHVGVVHVEFDWEGRSVREVLEEIIQRIESKRHRPVFGAGFSGVPMTALCKFTGDPASDYGDEVGERLSAACLGKRAFVTEARAGTELLLKRLMASEELASWMSSHGKESEFALEFDHLAPADSDVNGSSYMAVARFDGNHIGQVIARILQKGSSNEEQVHAFAEFCHDLNEATLDAFGSAGIAVLTELLRSTPSGRSPFWEQGETVRFPIRPLVCGGDDLAVVLRGDLGLSFAVHFLRAFERSTEAVLGSALTAAAGITMVPTHYPFVRPYEIAEGLLRCAKEKSRERSIIDFQVLRGDAPADILRVRGTEYTAEDGCELTCRPLDLDELRLLLRRAAAIKDRLPRHHVKHAVDLCRLGEAPAREAYVTLRANLERSLGGRHGVALMGPEAFGRFYPEGFFSDGKTDLLDCVEVAEFLGPGGTEGLV
jgi:hypothetical protein